MSKVYGVDCEKTCDCACGCEFAGFVNCACIGCLIEMIFVLSFISGI